MTDSFKQLIEVAYDIKLYLGVGSYSVHQYEDGSFVEFKVHKIENARGLIELANGLKVLIFHCEDDIRVRVEEDTSDLT